MDFDRFMEERTSEMVDRDVIRIESPSDSAGIAAALRRAFRAAAEEPSTHDFDALLRRLN